MSLASARHAFASFMAWEAVTSLGESAAETALLLRAGLSNVCASRFVDGAGERVRMCAAPAVPLEIGGLDRAAALASLALGRLAEAIDVKRQAVLLLALPDSYGAADAAFARSPHGRSFLDTVRRSLKRAASLDIEIFPFGRAAGAVALRRAVEFVDQDRLVIWGGVDTMYDWTVLETLERDDRLLTAENVDGVRPGEGAAFVALGPSATRGIHVVGIGAGREPSPVGSGKPCRSLGLTAALDAAVAPLRDAGRRSNCWLLDTSHEAYATQELQNVIARFGDVLGLEAELHMPLKELGDAGAAAMPLLAVLGAEAWRLGYANDDTAVITGCSKDGARGALLLAADSFHRTEMAA